jgi:hypothetical protein
MISGNRKGKQAFYARTSVPKATCPHFPSVRDCSPKGVSSP